MVDIKQVRLLWFLSNLLQRSFDVIVGLEDHGWMVA